MTTTSRRIVSGVAVVLAGYCGASAVSAPAARLSCNALRGKQVVKTRSVRVVSRSVRTVYSEGGTIFIGTEYLACAPPFGVVRSVASTGANYIYPGPIDPNAPIDSTFTSFGQSAGRFVLMRTRAANLTGDFFERTFQVLNVASGRTYTYYHYLQDAKRTGDAPPFVVKLGRDGALVGLFVNWPADPPSYRRPAKGMELLLAFTPVGQSRVLDQAPTGAIRPGSLALAGNRVAWTNRGIARSSTL